MTKFHIEWQKNTSLMPADPAKMIQLNISMLEMVKADLKSGMLTDWGHYCNGSNGYCIVEGTETDMVSFLLKYSPYILFDVKPVISADQTIEANKLAAQSKTR